jgi:hypothetical protein
MATPREWLVSALERLAMPADSQIRYLTALGVAPCADELALEFDDALPGAPLSPAEKAHLSALDRYLSRMSGPSHASLWTTGALVTSAEWIEVRRLARQALADIAGRA